MGRVFSPQHHVACSVTGALQRVDPIDDLRRQEGSITFSHGMSWRTAWALQLKDGWRPIELKKKVIIDRLALRALQVGPYAQCKPERGQSSTHARQALRQSCKAAAPPTSGTRWPGWPRCPVVECASRTSPLLLVLETSWVALCLLPAGAGPLVEAGLVSVQPGPAA